MNELEFQVDLENVGQMGKHGTAIRIFDIFKMFGHVFNNSQQTTAATSAEISKEQTETNGVFWMRVKLFFLAGTEERRI